MRRSESSRHGRPRVLSPICEWLEGRKLLALASQTAAQIAQVRYVSNDYASYVQTLELHSRATTAEYLALRDDALAISEAASTTNLSPNLATARATAASLQLDRAFLDGFLDDQGWADLQSRLEANLSGLNVPQPLIDQTITDMKAAAESAGVSAGAYATFTAKANQLRDTENFLKTGYVHFDDPQLFYTQHLRGFIRGGTADKHQAAAQLGTDVQAIAASSGDPGASGLLNRDVRLLEQIGSRVSVRAFAQVGDALTTAFASGSPSPSDQAQLATSLQQAIGPAQARSTLSAVDRLAADAPALFAAVDHSQDNVATIVRDVTAFVEAGGGAPLNPFRVQIHRTGKGP